MDKKKMDRRAYALEAALKASAEAGNLYQNGPMNFAEGEVLAYAKFVLGKDPAKKKRRRTKVQGGERRAYVAKKGTPLPRSLDDLTGGGWKPVGEDPGDREVLTQWAEAIRQRNAEQEAALEGEKLERTAEAEAVLGDDGRPFWNSRPEVALREAGSIVKRKDLSATWAPQRHEPETSEKAPDRVVRQGAIVGCPECSAEAERRKERKARQDRGRVKLASRVASHDQVRTGPLDEDELLAVAGGELYPAGDEEPSREVKIRNRKGEVRTFAAGGRQESAGWTAAPLDGWSLRLPWTSSEMVRRGPWHAA